MHKSFLYLLVVVSFLSACNNDIAEHPPLKEIIWITHHDPELRYTIQVPTIYTSQQSGHNYIFLMEGDPVLMVNHITKEEAATKGTWAKHKVFGEHKLDTIPGLHYRYKHSDGPYYTLSNEFVIPYREKYFSIAFQSSDGILDEVQKKILQSVRFY